MRNALLIPLSWLYTLGVHIRHKLYDYRLLPSVSVSVPTINVGNLAVGGTGKTPHVEYIVRLLTQHGYHVAVLSRGYKRKKKGFQLVSREGSAADYGDEPLQLARKFPSVTVAVDKDRMEGCRKLAGGTAPETVAPASLPLSRIMTRVMLTRFFAMILERPSCASTEPTPISASITEYRSMTTR